MKIIFLILFFLHLQAVASLLDSFRFEFQKIKDPQKRNYYLSLLNKVEKKQKLSNQEQLDWDRATFQTGVTSGAQFITTDKDELNLLLERQKKDANKPPEERILDQADLDYLELREKFIQKNPGKKVDLPVQIKDSTIACEKNKPMNGVEKFANFMRIQEVQSSLGTQVQCKTQDFRSAPRGIQYDIYALKGVRNQFAAIRSKMNKSQVASFENSRSIDRLNLKKANGETLSEQDYIDMDVLARTIYGEMTACAKRNAQGRAVDFYNAPIRYKHAVACTILHRVQQSRKIPEYLRGNHSENRRGAVSKASLAPMQYSMWNHAKTGNPSSLLRRVMCPDKNSQAWQESANVAANAIINKEKFMNDCREVNSSYYTSWIRMPANASFKWIEKNPPPRFPAGTGQPLSDKSCIRIWNRSIDK